MVSFVGGTLAVGLASGLTATGVPETYTALAQPDWAPPPAVFGPVWTVLYLMIGLAGFLIWRQKERGHALKMWGVQMALNVVWTPLFFLAGERGWALVDIVVLLGLIAACMAAFYRLDKRATYLFFPYFLWVMFASALNYSIWSLNR